MTRQSGHPQSTRASLFPPSGWPLLLVAGSVLVVSNGRWMLAPAAWLAPILLMRYLRSGRIFWKSLAALWVVHALVMPIAWVGLWPFPPLVMARLAVVGALLSVLPYLLDRLSVGRVGAFGQTLIFPSTAVALEFLGSLRSHSTWGNLAYTQVGNLPLLQFASVAGIWGITFLVLWLAPTVNNIWQHGWRSGAARPAAGAYAATLVLVLGLGTMRLLLFAPSGATLRVATVTPPEIADFNTPEGQQFLGAFQQIFSKQDVDDRTIAHVKEGLAALEDPLFDATRREARSGADLVVWPEAGLISFDDEQDRVLIERGRQLAREEGIYLGLTIAKVPPRAGHLNENRLLLINPAGDVLHTYWKHQTVPVVEEPFAVPGSDEVLAVDTSAGTLGGVICYDMDSPAFLRGAGHQQVDVLMAPSGDWPAIKDLHSRMAVMRAVEQGFSLVRPANHGLTTATDYHGRILDSLDHYTTSERRMSTSVPRQGVSTMYTRIGDVWPWASVAMSGLFATRILLLIGAHQDSRRRRVTIGGGRRDAPAPAARDPRPSGSQPSQ